MSGMAHGCGLVIEGGGMRGFYAAGILGCLFEEGIAFPLVIGVSSGALNAVGFVAGSCEVNFDALDQPLGAFVNPRGIVRPQEGMLRTDALVDAFTAGRWQAVMHSPTRLLVPATDAQTGELVWWDQTDFATGPDALRQRVTASASIPVVMPRATVDGRVFADGGIRDSIPVTKALECGCERLVCILTRPRGYVKGTQHLELYLRRWLAPYPKLKEAMLTRHVRYNASARRAEALEDQGSAFVMRMGAADQVLGRFEYNVAKFRACYEHGYQAARERLEELRAFVG